MTVIMENQCCTAGWLPHDVDMYLTNSLLVHRSGSI